MAKLQDRIEELKSAEYAIGCMLEELCKIWDVEELYMFIHKMDNESFHNHMVSICRKHMIENSPADYDYNNSPVYTDPSDLIQTLRTIYRVFK